MSTPEIQVDEKGKLKCCLEDTLSVIGGKWKLVILWHLGKEGIHRYNELRRLMPGITHKMLSQKLKELEADGLINRKQYNEVPPKVEYSLTKKGYSVMPILDTMHKWGRENE
ncbi:winged helix-turn-helix transcriptional regulator [Tepidibacter hydrothermalis]|uniref:Winged helix-turn-helix transcriptional regulator n=1 Tax=Tepidibacter hydrothermalis TaxID=3036126 RepID=A0ABY8EBC9_9FIRM|nr:winged helix-turn-helix transcriptional regulator [Tepidibacter hydrothermalis]WFD10209.1 winged helix-turn-helix transcriptional regulator [Tepidibacter hydrothermalis]